MKIKIFTIILGLLLIISIVGNIVLFNNNKKSSDLIIQYNAEIEELETAVVNKETELKESENKVSELEKQITDLQSQLDILNETLLASEEQKEMDELNELLSQEIDNYRQLSPYAGKTSKHGWVYPDDYIEYGTRYVDMRGDVESLFDMGAISEEEYQECIKVLGDPSDYQSESTSNSQSMDDVAKKMVAQDTPSPSTGDTGNSNAAPIELPKSGIEYEKTGRICY